MSHTREQTGINREVLRNESAALSNSRFASFFFWSLIGGTAIVGIICLGTSLEWINQPFPGFFISAQRIVSLNQREGWTGRRAGLRAADLIVAVDGKPLSEPGELARWVVRRGAGRTVNYTIQRGGTELLVPVKTMRFGLGDLFFTFFLHYLNGVISLLLGAFVYFRRPHDHAAQTLLVLCLAWATLNLAYFDVNTIHQFYRLEPVLVLIPAALLRLTLIFPERGAMVRRYPWTQYLPYLASGGLFLVWQLYITNPNTHLLFFRLSLPYMFLLLALALLLLFYSYRKATTPIARQQCKVILKGGLVTLGLTGLGTLSPSLFGAKGLSPDVTNLFTLIFPLSIAYAVLRYRVFDIDVIIRRGLLYSALGVALGGLYFLLVALFQRAFQVLIGRSSNLAGFVSALVIAFLFAPLRARLQEFIDRTFYRAHYDYHHTLLDFGHSLRTIIDVEELLEQLLTQLRDTMNISHVALLQQTGPDTSFVITRDIGLSLDQRFSLLLTNPLLRRLRAGEIVTSPLFLVSRGVKLAVPIISRERLSGVVALGPKLSGFPYTKEDRALLATLADQAAAVMTIAQLVEENKEKQRLEQELQLARNLQMRLLPQEPPRHPNLEIAWICRPARETNGDFYDYIPLPDDKLGLIVADVTGKGLSAAMMATGARITVRTEIGPHHSPAATLAAANGWLCQDMPTGTFVAVVYGIIEPARSVLTIANAGQLTPLLQRGDACQYLENDGTRLPLGIDYTADYTDREISLRPKDVLLFYTDGIVEAMNETGEMYGFERLEAALMNAPANSAQQVLDYLLAEVETFVGAAETHDDMTAVVMRVAG